MRNTGAMTERSWTFSEREFYLAEFRGRTLGIALPERPADSLENLARVVAELKAGGMPILLAEQNLRFTAPLADRAYVLESGEVRMRGGMDELAADERVRELLSL